MAYFRAGTARATHEAQQITVTKTPLATFESNVSGLYIPEILAYIQATQSGTGDPSPSNPRAINGVNSVDTTRTGKNLFDLNCLTATGITIADGVASGTAASFNTAFNLSSGGIPCFVPQTPFTLSFKAYTDGTSGTSGNGLMLRIYYTDNTYTQLYLPNGTTTATTFTVSSNVNKTPNLIMISYGTTSSNTWYLSEIQLELGNTATPYEAYTGTTATTALGGTYYGGYLNVTTGLLTVTDAIVDLGGLTWTYRSGNKLFTAYKSGIKLSSDAKGTPCLCDIYKATYGGSWSGWANFPNEHISSGNNYSSGDANIAVKDLRFTDKDTFKTAMSGVYLVYELATPQTVQLTPAQVTQLLGQNNVFASTGDVAVKYWRID